MIAYLNNCLLNVWTICIIWWKSIEQEHKTEAEPDPTGHYNHNNTMMIVGEGDNYHNLPTYIPKLIKQ